MHLFLTNLGMAASIFLQTITQMPNKIYKSDTSEGTNLYSLLLHKYTFSPSLFLTLFPAHFNHMFLAYFNSGNLHF